MKKKRVLFLTDNNNINFQIPGGVQLCTSELLDYFRLGGYDPLIFKINQSLSLAQRIKIRLGIEVYDRYEFRKLSAELVKFIDENNINLLAINQLNLCPIIEYIKPHVDKEFKFIALSHGNESGDFIHDISRNRAPSAIETWKLGKQLIFENLYFSKYLDGVVVISEHEVYINEWIGALNQLFLPRILKPNFLRHQPQKNVIGFVGTLNHLPNTEGIRLLANELKLLNFAGRFHIVGGPSEKGKKLQQEFPFISYRGKLSEDDLIEEVKTWSIFLNPVFWYSRGSSTKLAQGINWGLPILSTLAGTRGYSLVDKDIVVEDNHPHSFAKQIIEKLNSQDLLIQLRKATETNARNFQVQTWVSKLSNFLDSL